MCVCEFDTWMGTTLAPFLLHMTFYPALLISFFPQTCYDVVIPDPRLGRTDKAGASSLQSPVENDEVSDLLTSFINMLLLGSMSPD